MTDSETNPADASRKDLITRPTEPLLREERFAPGLPPAVLLTDTGIAWLRQLSKLDMSVKSIASMFGMSDDWLKKQLRETPEVKRAFDMGQAEHEAEYRLARDMLSKMNAQVHIHHGKTKYGEIPVERKEQTVTVHVVGTLPGAGDEIKSIDDWRQQFAPKDALDFGAPSDAVVEDAEIVSTDRETAERKTAERGDG